MYDAIIVGARCAGSPTAMLLARKGYRVLLVDRARFPSDTMSTHYIQQAGMARLQRWGLLERVAASNCPPITQVKFDFGPFTVAGSPLPADGVAAAYAPRRTVLDQILVEAAVAAGAELREGFSVRELITDADGRITGLRGGADGATVTEAARIVIGADGQHSLVARAVRAPTYRERPAMTCGYYSYWSGVPLDGFEIFPRDGKSVAAIPTNDGLACLIAGWAIRDFPEYRSNVEGNYLKTFELAPSLAERMRGGKRVERILGTADMVNFFRKPYGPGWALVGDAGYHKDPCTAQGITDALRDAELLSDAIDAGFSGHRPLPSAGPEGGTPQTLEEALAGYEQRRNEAAMPLYEFTCRQASFEPPPPEQQRLLAAVAGNPEQTSRFLGILAGTTHPAEFFAPENVGRVLAAAA